MFSSPDHTPPRWLFVALTLCLAAIFAALMGRPDTASLSVQAVETAPVATVIPPTPAAPTPAPAPTPEPTPETTPEPDWSQPVPVGEAVDQEEWFSDAVFIGDSRTDGFRLFSGITSEADFLVHTGITVYDVVDGKNVIRRGDKKVSSLDALAERQYGKVYISLGVNELGYRAPENFAETYGKLIDAIREREEDAAIYIQSIIPVNTEKCKANDQLYYVTNENIAAYNETLSAMAEEKKVRLVNVAEALIDENGEAVKDLSADGVHFKKDGYILWLDYLTTHTGP